MLGGFKPKGLQRNKKGKLGQTSSHHNGGFMNEHGKLEKKQENTAKSQNHQLPNSHRLIGLVKRLNFNPDN